MNNVQAAKIEIKTCTCGHPDREHSACSGECYLCGCKHYTPAKTGPVTQPLLARAYHRLLIWLKRAN